MFIWKKWETLLILCDPLKPHLKRKLLEFVQVSHIFLTNKLVLTKFSFVTIILVLTKSCSFAPLHFIQHLHFYLLVSDTTPTGADHSNHVVWKVTRSLSHATVASRAFFFRWARHLQFKTSGSFTSVSSACSTLCKTEVKEMLTSELISFHNSKTQEWTLKRTSFFTEARAKTENEYQKALLGVLCTWSQSY